MDAGSESYIHGLAEHNKTASLLPLQELCSDPESEGATIPEYTQLYAPAARKAVCESGFHGVEIHAANGFLVDQCLQDVTNP
jgi:2,4-dienoyl-CoA reductase-like NADH-dependent reductase (Old Yellow Enzyme family)